MTCNWFKDIQNMHLKFKAGDAVDKMSPEMLHELLKFRASMINEEYNELLDAIEDNNPEEIVDALIDILVFSAGTLELFKVDGHKAWNKVFNANMRKEPGIKPERPNPFGFSDMIKPKGWRAPSHKNNHGLFTKLNEE